MRILDISTKIPQKQQENHGYQEHNPSVYQEMQDYQKHPNYQKHS